MAALQDREQIQLSFCAGKIKVVVATVAFGMGVDAQGVRGVVHLTLPRSLEEYVQQVSFLDQTIFPSDQHLVHEELQLIDSIVVMPCRLGERAVMDQSPTATSSWTTQTSFVCAP